MTNDNVIQFPSLPAVTLLAIDNRHGALLSDELTPGGALACAEAQHQRVDGLRLGEDGYRVYAIDNEWLVDQIVDRQDPKMLRQFGRLVACFRAAR